MAVSIAWVPELLCGEDPLLTPGGHVHGVPAPPHFLSSHTDLVVGPGGCHTLSRPEVFLHVLLWESKFPLPQLPFLPSLDLLS